MSFCVGMVAAPCDVDKPSPPLTPAERFPADDEPASDTGTSGFSDGVYLTRRDRYSVICSLVTASGSSDGSSFWFEVFPRAYCRFCMSLADFPFSALSAAVSVSDKVRDAH